VLVVLTRGYQPDTDALKLMADLSRMAWESFTRTAASR
jgi:hypothetical protein